MSGGAQKRNDEMVDLLSPEFMSRNEEATARIAMLPMAINLPGLRGLWMYGSIDETSQVFDHSEQNRTLSVQANGSIAFGNHGCKPYVESSGSANNYLRRADEAGLDLTDEISVYSWVWFDLDPSGFQLYFCKWRETTPGQRSWYLARNSSGQAVFKVEDNVGSAATLNNTVAPIVPKEQWTFNAGTMKLSTGDMDIFTSGLDGNGKQRLYQRSATAVRNNLANSNADLTQFADGNGLSRLDGRLAFTAIYAAKHEDYMVQQFYEFTKSLFGV